MIGEEALGIFGKEVTTPRAFFDLGLGLCDCFTHFKNSGPRQFGLTLPQVVGHAVQILRSLGKRGLGLNFAVMRSVLANEAGDRMGHRIERRMLGWLSDSMQIESLWKYNAKFDPDWHPRYAVYDSPENFFSSAVAVAKAESFCDLPLVGRFFAPDEPPVGTSASGASSPSEFE